MQTSNVGGSTSIQNTLQDVSAPIPSYGQNHVPSLLTDFVNAGYLCAQQMGYDTTSGQTSGGKSNIDPEQVFNQRIKSYQTLDPTVDYSLWNRALHETFMAAINQVKSGNWPGNPQHGRAGSSSQQRTGATPTR